MVMQLQERRVSGGLRFFFYLVMLSLAFVGTIFLGKAFSAFLY
jgi:hypothetical protein